MEIYHYTSLKNIVGIQCFGLKPHFTYNAEVEFYQKAGLEPESGETLFFTDCQDIYKPIFIPKFINADGVIEGDEIQMPILQHTGNRLVSFRVVVDDKSIGRHVSSARNTRDPWRWFVTAQRVPPEAFIRIDHVRLIVDSQGSPRAECSVAFPGPFKSLILDQASGCASPSTQPA